MADQFGRRAYGSITAVQAIAITLSSGGGVFGAGWLYDKLGSYTMAFGLCATAFGLAAVGFFLTPRPTQMREKSLFP
jgi:hypothetical protein